MKRMMVRRWFSMLPIADCFKDVVRNGIRPTLSDDDESEVMNSCRMESHWL
jgi:hypothetical protein